MTLVSQPLAAAIDKLGRAIVLAPVVIFRVGVSSWLPPSCRFLPSCSDYAMQAVQQHGAVRGAWMAGGRLLRCHPWCAGGIDEVPQPRRSPGSMNG
jgi:uncharacterized protein